MSVLRAGARPAQTQPSVFQSDPAAMFRLRERAAANDPAIGPALTHLKEEADRAMTKGPWSVTKKKHASPTGDPHDYISLAPYFWPNPDTKDGLPYVRHDGRRNPEIREYDAANFGAMSGSAYRLALAYYLTGNDAYAERAALVLRTWFLDPATRMNPNLDHGQMVKGVNDGRGTGIIEADRLLDVVDAAGLLAGSSAWTEEDRKGLQAWFKEFVGWMRESKRGHDEAAAKNNHGMWFD
ncbi:MAG TPA: alginate lyase family protein, partial [Tepidisphaeraceae bacterium]|nr:alginate lyase family protein [Tepidisphaeraceae bacterium]